MVRLFRERTAEEWATAPSEVRQRAARGDESGYGFVADPQAERDAVLGRLMRIPDLLPETFYLDWRALLEWKRVHREEWTPSMQRAMVLVCRMAKALGREAIADALEAETKEATDGC